MPGSERRVSILSTVAIIELGGSLTDSGSGGDADTYLTIIDAARVCLLHMLEEGRIGN